MHNFPRPTQERLFAQRSPVDETCPECGSSTAVAEYRVLGEGGWWDVTKCQDCLYTVTKTRTPRLGSFTPVVPARTAAGVGQRGSEHDVRS